MNFDKAVQEIQRAALLYGLLEIVLFCVFMWVLYEVVKAAVKNGINESYLGQRLGKEPSLYEKMQRQIEPKKW